MVGRLGHLVDRIGRGAVTDHFFLIGRNGRIATGNQAFRGESFLVFTITTLGDWLGEEFVEERLELGKVDAVLGTLRSGDARYHRREVEIEFDTVIDLTLAGHAKHSLSLEVVFESSALGLGASRGTEECD